MHRFFVSPQVLKQHLVVLGGGQAHQIQRVLRLRPGDAVILLDNTGLAYQAELTGYGREEAHFRVTDVGPAPGEPALHLTLYQAVLKGERFAWLLQKGAELGVSRFVPLICHRNVVEDRAAIEGKRERWERIIQEAAEQSCRARLPELAAPAAFADAVSAARSGGVLRLIPWEGERAVGLREALRGQRTAEQAAAGAGFGIDKTGEGPGEQGTGATGAPMEARVEVFIGPEGGLTEEEVRLAEAQAVRPVSLGPRILRAETAGIAVAAAVMFAAGEMEP